jgi:hypothetical protein
MIDYSSPLPAQDLAYDLRQTYAKIVGDNLLDIAEARRADNYYVWYKCLEDLHTIIKHKFKSLKTDEADYNKIKKDVMKLANEYKQSWLNKSSNSEHNSLIETTLRELEEFLYLKMSEAKMFGEGGKIAGL